MHAASTRVQLLVVFFKSLVQAQNIYSQSRPGVSHLAVVTICLLPQVLKPTVLLIGGLTHTNKECEDLESKYNLKEFRRGTREQFLSNCKSGKYDDVVALYRSNTSTSETGPFNEELVSVLPKSLKYICHNGAGYDNIDVDVCTRKGFKISSTPIAVDDATADIGLFLMLGALRLAWVPMVAIREGKWRGKTELGHDPKGKTLGILGMGGIGRVRHISCTSKHLLNSAGNGSSSTSIRDEDSVSQSIKAAERA